MRVIGITGKYCAGKDTATAILRELGYQEINVDAVGHEALAMRHDAVVERFGSRIVGEDGEIDRGKLGAIVFREAEQLRELEAIVHPVMVQMVEQRIDELRDRANPPPGAVINAAILFRMGLARLCDLVVFVEASLLTRFRRARQRDGAGLLSVLRRLLSQRDVAPQFSLRDADIHSVKNDGNQEQLRTQLEALLQVP